MRTETRRVRPVRLCAPEVLVDRRPDGTLYLKSSRTLPAYPEKLTDRLVHWAREAPDRVFMAERNAGGWRTITYAQTLDKVRRIGAALLTRISRPSARSRSSPATISSMRCSGLRQTMSAFPMRRFRPPIR